MPNTCILLLLDGLGDRSYERLGGKTPLQAASTPHLDALASRGGLGLYHAGCVGQALPSENAHFAMFGRRPEEFPGRGALEALGCGLDLKQGEVAVLAHIAAVEDDGSVFRLKKDVPKVDTETAAELVQAVDFFEADGVSIRYHAFKGTFGVLVLSGNSSPFFTDTGVMLQGAVIPQIQPFATHVDDPATLATCRALTKYVLHARSILKRHPVNQERIQQGVSPLDFIVTQRPGRATAVPSFRQSHGLNALSISNGAMYRGLCRHLGMAHESAPDSGDVEADYRAALAIAECNRAAFDFIHVHTKAPDQAAHSKDPRAKLEAIEALDRAIGVEGMVFAADPDVLLVVAADHSTPSSGPLIHSGEPVPLLFHGKGVRRDEEVRFDEIAAARGALGTVRGSELMLCILNALDRVKLTGIMDTPQDQPYYPGDCEPFPISDEG
ncbi:alkaline phosphatase family protein [uncultured Pseudodesulfovibrio sp.]|uniref:alkaline phosphatase family protein n=1 Tax=uncultured Pseudodesulfovibrio sp. TaxID=2035858 RepID=UPI0029C6A47A|nr:alkaline phosphatase family protein [uncultured Pseudodesulfovibrio sp.]